MEVLRGHALLYFFFLSCFLVITTQFSHDLDIMSCFLMIATYLSQHNTSCFLAITTSFSCDLDITKVVLLTMIV